MKRRATQGQTIERRKLLATAAAGATALALGQACKSRDESSKAPAPATAASASQPEMTDLRFGMIALTDCSPIVIAHEKGIFKKYGINSTIVKGASWAAIRDSLSVHPVQSRSGGLGG